MKRITFIALIGLIGLILFLPFISATITLGDFRLYYDFNSNKELVSGIYNLTANQGTVVYNSSNCKIGSCGQYFPSNNNLIPINNFTTMNGSYSFNFWVRITTAGLPDENIFLAYKQGISNRISAFDSTSWLWGGIMNGGNIITSRTPVVNNNYFMITITRDGSNSNVTSYVNGLIEANGTTGMAGGLYNPLWLGVNNDNNSVNALKGQMDEFGVINRTLSQTEIEFLYNSGNGRAFGDLGTDVTVVLDNPSDGALISSSSASFNASITPPSSYNLTNATIYLYNQTNDLVNTTTNIITGNVLNKTNWTLYNLTSGNWKWNVLGCAFLGADTVCDFAPNNFTFSRRTFSIDAESYDTNVYETDNSTFFINVTIESGFSLFSVTLNYNGTNYQADKITSLGFNRYAIAKTIDIPIVFANATRTFNWLLTFGDGDFFSENSTIRQQNVSNTSILNTGTLSTVNYTLYDEETLQGINASFKATFNWYLGGGTIEENISFNLVKNNSFKFFNIPSQEKFYTSSFIALTNVSIVNQTYNEKIFDFNKEQFTNITTEKNLLFLRETNGTDIKIEVRDTGGVTVENIFVRISRYYPEDNKFRMVENRRTDNFGQFTARLIEDSVRYKFEFFNENNTLLKTEDNIHPSCRTIICILPFIIADTTDDFGRYKNITGFTSSLNYFNSSRKFVFTWNDASEEVTSVRLEITKFLFNGTTIVYNATSPADVGTLNYSATSERASYQAQGYATFKGEERRVELISIVIGNKSSTFGLEGLFVSFILLFTLIIFGLYSPSVGVTIYLISYLMLGFFDIIYINPAIAIAQIVIGVLFIWAFKS